MTTVFEHLGGAVGLTVKEVAYAVVDLVAPFVCDVLGPHFALFLSCCSCTKRTVCVCVPVPACSVPQIVTIALTHVQRLVPQRCYYSHTHTDVAFMGALTAAYAIQSTALVIGSSIVLGAGTAVMWTSVSEVVDSHCNDHNRGLTHAVFLAMCTSFRAVCNRVYFVANS